MAYTMTLCNIVTVSVPIILIKLRDVADYGLFKHVDAQEATESVKAGERILQAVHDYNPGLFPMPAADGKDGL